MTGLSFLVIFPPIAGVSDIRRSRSDRLDVGCCSCGEWIVLAGMTASNSLLYMAEH